MILSCQSRHGVHTLAALALSALVGCVTTTAGGTPADADPRGGAPSGDSSAASSGATATGKAEGPTTTAGPIQQIGLMTTYDPFGGVTFRPVLVLRDGHACNCVDEDLGAFDLAAVEQRRPNDLGTWRKAADRIEVQWSGKTSWAGLSKVAAVGLGQAWRSSSSYNRTTSTGVAGAGNWVGTTKTITFDPNGRFSLAGGTSTEVSASTSNSTGVYDVNGYMLTLKFDGGTTKTISAVTGADEPGRVLWLNGSAYTQ